MSLFSFKEKIVLLGKIVSLVEIPNDEKILELALSFGKLALNDAQAADALYNAKLYGLSMYHIQQSVEKSAKGFGLLTTALKPDDLKIVSHNSLLAVLLYLKSNAPKLISTLDDLSPVFGVIEKFGLINKGEVKIFIENAQKQVNAGVYDKLINEIKKSKKNVEMWKATLNLDLNNEIVSSALKGLQTKNHTHDLIIKLIDLLSRIFRNKLSKKDIIKLKITSILFFNTASLLLSLSSLTTWHEEETRYPPTSDQDAYWNPFDYDKKKKLVHFQNTLIDKSKTLSNSIVDASTQAKEYILIS
jgi:hypothetical protein